MILVDSNIFMYAGGAEHPHKGPSVAYLEQIARGKIDAVIDTEVLQEILHRYRALRRWSDGQRVYDLTRQIVPTVLPVTVDDLDVARDMLDGYERLQARDAVHAAVAAANGIREICSYDSDFDGLEGLERIEPRHSSRGRPT